MTGNNHQKGLHKRQGTSRISKSTPLNRSHRPTREQPTIPSNSSLSLSLNPDTIKQLLNLHPPPYSVEQLCANRFVGDGAKVLRPSNCWILYRTCAARRIRELPQFKDMQQQQFSEIIAGLWKKCSQAEKEEYRQLQYKVKELHKKYHRDWIYRPEKGNCWRVQKVQGEYANNRPTEIQEFQTIQVLTFQAQIITENDNTSNEIGDTQGYPLNNDNDQYDNGSINETFGNNVNQQTTYIDTVHIVESQLLQIPTPPLIFSHGSSPDEYPFSSAPSPTMSCDEFSGAPSPMPFPDEHSYSGAPSPMPFPDEHSHSCAQSPYAIEIDTPSPYAIEIENPFSGAPSPTISFDEFSGAPSPMPFPEDSCTLSPFVADIEDQFSFAPSPTMSSNEFSCEPSQFIAGIDSFSYPTMSSYSYEIEDLLSRALSPPYVEDHQQMYVGIVHCTHHRT